jgi:hypothetical protein
MRYGYFLATALAVSTSVIAYEPAEERDFGEFAASGCRNRDGDFIVRGLVSSATEDTVVLSDPANSRTTTSVTLPGRGPFSRVRGAFGKNKQEASKEALDELRRSRTLVVLTLQCKGDGTPLAQQISYVNPDGTHAAISF